MFSLDGFVDDAVDYTEGVEVNGVAGHTSVCNLLILLVEVGEERRTVVTAIGLSKEVEVSCRVQGTNFGVELWDCGQKCLKNMLLRLENALPYVLDIDILTHVAMAARSVVSTVPVFKGSKSGQRPVAGQSLEL